ncbi:transporter%2C solute:sodium symporter (SSS) family [Chlamydia trachomatis]|nr:transporter%2C solute:sodium symporter (SSS) family [Chlamydia trachomatis]
MLYTYYSSKGYDVDGRTAISTIVQVKNAANNQLLSYFIISVLPIGISGLILSSVFAASQSTISSSLNSLVTTIIVDF